MGTMCVPSKTLWHTFKRLQMGIFGFSQKKTGAKSVAMATWQQQYRCHSVSFTMYTAAAKFEEHCLNISRVILN